LQKGWLTVVGVAGDVRLDGIAQTELPQLYLPYAQFPTSILHLFIRTAGEPVRLAGAVSREIAVLDRDQPVFDVKSLEDVMAESTTRADVLTGLLGAFAAIAVLLAVIGIYGVTACSTSRRTREIGVRMALGARPIQVVRLIGGQALPAVLAGAAAGVAGALLAARVLRTFLVGVGMADPLTFAVVPVMLLTVVTVAACVPALRAARIDPMSALKND
jgi:putative ABC transport system permease protein